MLVFPSRLVSTYGQQRQEMGCRRAGLQECAIVGLLLVDSLYSKHVVNSKRTAERGGLRAEEGHS